MIKFEEFLAPWEADDDGKKLDEPADIDPGRLKKFLYGLLSDKEKAQEARTEAENKAAQAADQLAQVQREHEDDGQRREREEKERQKEMDDLRKANLERKKIEALEDAFPDATSARIKKLAKRVTGDEKDWVDDAKDLVADGFKISEKPVEQQDDGDDPDDIRARPQVRRSNGRPADQTATSTKAKSVAEELDAAGVGQRGW